ncbi:MAG TPA: 3-octaprenyl-4-hydroxybenzoate carboxy-lyase, partial [Geobacteraceae bacterium]|nr:3-octaprenyl-4-hydroxybenzoate carboxy-lyase [Geobacteraceae bacterium]
LELLTQASAILGQGQLSLAKYLFIAPHEDNPPEIHHVDDFLRFVLERADWRTNLHFHTATTIDTLDYSGSSLNKGSKVVVAVAGPVRRKLATELSPGLRLPDGFTNPRICLPGVLAVSAPPCSAGRNAVDPLVEEFCRVLGEGGGLPAGLPLVVVVDDSDFTARTLNNFLWTVFTRSNPASDIYGIGAFTHCKHWGCRGALVIDARTKPHHAPPLVEDPEVVRRVESLAAPGGPLHGLY